MSALATPPKPAAGSGGSLKELLEGRKDSLASVATKHLTPEKLIRMLGAAASRVPKLLKCTPLSVLNAAMTCSELGLAPGTLGTIHLVPYENRKAGTIECQAIVGYKGLVTLARRSGDIGDIQCECVREGDAFTYEYGVDTKFSHKPKANNLDAPITGVWCLAKFRSGGHQFTYMTIEEVEKIKSRSRAKNDGPWVTDYSEMVKKTCIRRAAKLWPLTPEVEHQIAVADKAEFTFTDLGTDEPPADVPKTNLDAARKAVANTADIQREVRAGPSSTPAPSNGEAPAASHSSAGDESTTPSGTGGADAGSGAKADDGQVFLESLNTTEQVEPGAKPKPKSTTKK